MNPRRGALMSWPTTLSAVWLLSLLPLVAQERRDEIRVLQKDGLIEISTDGGRRWVRTDVNQRLRVGDRLRTGGNTRASLVWADSKVLTISPFTEIEVIAPLMPGEPGVHLWRGILWFFDRDQPGRGRVKTAGVAAGIKGTEFVMAVENGNGVSQTTVSVVDGIVELQNEQGTLTISNAQQAVIISGQEPRRTAGFIVRNVLQWAFYYPGVLNPDDLPFADAEKTALAESLAEYRAGDLLAALEAASRRGPQSENESLYLAALLLSAGQVEQSVGLIERVAQAGPADAGRRIFAALRVLIAGVKGEPAPSGPEPETATELLAASYYEQSRAGGDVTLRKALELAREAASRAPEFGFAWARVAELEFSFGNFDSAMESLARGLALSPRNAQALALRGFVFAARNQPREAIRWFDRAIELDSFLANAWLGRGLCRIRRGNLQEGREDLLIAAALEPQRAVLRSYLGKAFGDAGDLERAGHELELAQRIDPKDPTAWLYSALLKADDNRLNEAIRDLERSQELNDNRSLYRSRLLLDQDRAVRSADIALLYDDAGLGEMALAEASRGITADYANYSAHLFLANSYLVARNTVSSPRFQTAAASEFLIARLLGPASGGLLAQSAGRNEPSMLFEQDKLGFISTTEYQSSGLWYQSAVQYGTYANSSYAVQGDFLWDPGETPHRESEFRFLSATFKHQVTPQDGLLLDVRDVWHEHENLAPRYHPNSAGGFRALERQEPNIVAGWNHEWSPEHRTLLTGSLINRSLDFRNKHGSVYLLTTDSGVPDGFFATDLTQKYEIESTFETLELQHIFAGARTRTIGGVRGHHATDRVANRHVLNNGNAINLESYFGSTPGTRISDQSRIETDSYRLSPYLYQYCRIVESLWVIGGVSYDYQTVPANTYFPPVVEDDGDIRQQFSPKAGVVWTPDAQWSIRAIYAQALGGVDLDQNLRIEPVHLAGIIHAHKNVFPVSMTGPALGARSETYALAVDRRWSSNTYLNVSAQWLRSRAERDVGAYRRDLAGAVSPNRQLEERVRSDELSGRASLHRLLGDHLTLGVRYEVSGAQFRRSHPTVSDTINFGDVPTVRGVLHDVGVDAVFRHSSGVFATASADWWWQRVSGTQPLLEDDFPFTRLSIGYRFPRRRAEITVGILNLTDQDYRLHPINLYPGMPRERTFFTRLDLSF